MFNVYCMHCDMLSACSNHQRHHSLLPVAKALNTGNGKWVSHKSPHKYCQNSYSYDYPMTTRHYVNGIFLRQIMFELLWKEIIFSLPLNYHNHLWYDDGKHWFPIVYFGCVLFLEFQNNDWTLLLVFV